MKTEGRDGRVKGKWNKYDDVTEIMEMVNVYFQKLLTRESRFNESEVEINVNYLQYIQVTITN